MPPGVSVIAVNMLDRSVYKPTQWTVANVSYLSIVHLVDSPSCDGTNTQEKVNFQTASNGLSHSHLRA